MVIGLLHLHSNGILHCDIKPNNIFFKSDDTIRLGDFGSTKDTDSIFNTTSSDALGTLFFYSPERFDGSPTIKSDIWALGFVLFFMLTGG
jgi:eukaryotic-like serine/threonine-protein kinase